MKMQFKNEIKKLADVVVWADNWIGKLKSCLTEEEFAEDEEVKVFEAVRKAVLDAMTRHAVYTDALNKDIADKAAKIDLLEKEIEGRKEGYTALKKRMDTDYISIEEHNNICEDFKKKIEKLKKESEKWQDLAKMNRDTICNQYDVCEDFKKKIVELEEKVKRQKENLDGINKTLEIRTKENESLIKVRNNLNKEIEAHESENARLSEKIISMNDTITELSHEIDNYKSWNAALHRDIKSEINGKNDLVDAYEKKYDEFEKKIAELERQNKYLTEELEKTYAEKEADLKNHNRRDMNLVDELAGKNDEIKKLKESIEELKKENMDHFKRRENDIVNQAKCISELKDEVTQYKELVDGLNKDLNYWKDQERIRTNQLRATENKVEELHGSINRLTLNCRSKNTEIARLAKEHADIRHELAKRTAESEFNEEDDHGRAGFKKYIEWLIEEEERAVPERFKERLNEEITAIFTKEEETEVKGVGRTSSGRYPWGAKVNDIPCGEDSIE